MVRIMYKEELHFLKKKVAYNKKKSELIRRVVKKCLDKYPL